MEEKPNLVSGEDALTDSLEELLDDPVGEPLDQQPSDTHFYLTCEKNWSAICWADGTVYKAKDYKGLEILDRVGGGDSFASGLIYGLMATGDPELAVNYGAAHGALAMTTPGDTTMASKAEVEALMGGGSARVKR